MMHVDSVVVTLVDDNKRPFREHDPEKLGSSPSKRKNGEQTGRKCRVLMPFETEFKILVKNQNDCRVKLNISIDGANVSGKGLILDAHETSYIERSVDVSQKFKFVRANHEDVADPTNEQNGEIVVKVWKEKKREWIYQNPIVYKHEPEKPWPVQSTPWWVDDNTGNNPHLDVSNCSHQTKGISNGSDICTSSAKSRSGDVKCFRSFTQSVAPQGEMGAVVDGGHSKQTFGKTTWNGNDGNAIKFIFTVRGVDDETAKIEEAELAELDRLQKKYCR